MDVTAITLGQPLSLSVSLSSPDAYPFRSQKSIGFSRKKQSKTLEELCAYKKHPKKSKNILLSMAKISKNVKKCVDVIYQQLT